MEEVKKEVKKAKPEQKKRTGNSVTGKSLDQIDTKPQLDNVTEEAGKAVVLTYGRFNPPTTGHEKLVNKVKAHAKKVGADHLIVASHSQDAKKNPLTADQKLHHLNRAFPDTNVAVSNKEHPSFIHQLKKLSGKYDHVHMVVGSDRVPEFEKVAHKYNGKEYNFKSIHIVSAGHRDPDAEGTEGMSASKMREHVKNNDIDSFKKGAPSKMSGSHVQRMFNDIRSGMGLHEDVEQIDEKTALTIAQRQVRARQMRIREPKLERKREIAKRKIAGKEQLQRRSMSAAREIVKKRFSAKKGVRYQELSTSEKIAVDRAVETKTALIKKIASRLMPKIRQAEYARFQSFTSGAPMQSMHSKPATIAASYEPSAIDKLFEQFFSEEQSRSLQTVVEADVPDSQNLDVLLRLGLADPEQLQMFRRAMKDPEKAVKEPLLRGKLVAVLNKIMDIVTKDPTIFAKTRMKIQQKEQKALFNKSQQTGLPLAIIEEVYTRGFENPHAGMTQEQSGFARVNSFIAGGKAAQEDNDLLENFMDGKGPGKPGDSARHGLKGKSTAELKSIRSSDSASPRKKQLAHFMLNMHHNEEVTLKEGIGSADPDYHAKVHQDLQWHAGRNRGNSMGAANYHHLMSLDDPSHIENYYEKTVHPILKKHNYPTPPVGPGDGGNPKYHAAVQEIIKNWRNEPRWRHNEETELDEKRGLWDNIHAKRKRIKSGSGERMRKPGSDGAPTKQNFKDASEQVEEDVERRLDFKMIKVRTPTGFVWKKVRKEVDIERDTE